MHNCATYPAAVKPVVDFCLEHDIGIVQMPCPELLVMGLGRDRDDPEQEYLCQALRMPLARKRIRKLAEQVVFQMKEYRFQGFTMLGVLGSNGSPSCGVERTAYPDPKKRFGPGEGVFIEELKALMKKEGLDLEFKGLDDHTGKGIAQNQERGPCQKCAGKQYTMVRPRKHAHQVGDDKPHEPYDPCHGHTQAREEGRQDEKRPLGPLHMDAQVHGLLLAKGQGVEIQAEEEGEGQSRKGPDHCQTYEQHIRFVE